MKKLPLILILTLASVTLGLINSLAQPAPECFKCGAAIRGVKFEDANGNGMRDVGEPLLPSFEMRLTGPIGSSYPTLGTQKASFNPPGSGAGPIGIAFDGQHLYYTKNFHPNIYKATTSGALVNILNTTNWIGALTWDCHRKRLWAGLYSGYGPQDIWAVDPATGQTIPGTLFTVPVYTTNSEAIDGLQYDPRDGTLWYSRDVDKIVYHVSLTGTLLGSFQIPFHNSFLGNSGIAFDGNNLWLALWGAWGTNMTRLVKVTDAGLPLIYFDMPGFLEDLEFDCVTFSPDNVLWAQYTDPVTYARRVQAYSISNSGVSTATVNSSGWYSFVALPPGTYNVSEFITPFWTQTAPPSGSYALTVNTGQTVSNLNFGNKKSVWNQLTAHGVLTGPDDPVNVALVLARKEIAGSDIGKDVTMWYARLNEKDWVTPLLRDKKNMALVMQLVEIGTRLVEKNGELRREDIPVIEQALHRLALAGTPAPRGLLPKVIQRLRGAVGRKWPEVVKALAGR